MICRRSSCFELIACAVLFACTTAALARTGYSLPLGGYYHPGRTMPLRLVEAGGSWTLHLLNAVPIEVTPLSRGVVPLLTLGDSVSDADGKLNALASDQRLVACDASLGDSAQSLFPDARIVRIDPPTIDGPALAWESLDGWLLDRPPPASVDAAALLAQGTTIAVRSPQRPAGPLQWQRAGALWIARPIAPSIEALAPVAYLPAQDWQLTLSPHERVRLLAIATLVSLISLASLLFARRGRSWVIACTVGGCIVGVLIWRNSRDPLRHVGGEIYLRRGEMRQDDRWTYWRTIRARAAHTPDRPVPVDAAQALALQLREQVSGYDGQIQWRFILKPGSTLVTLRRQMDGDFLPLASSARHSPLESIAKNYGDAHSIITPVRLSPDRDWPDVRVAQP